MAAKAKNQKVRVYYAERQPSKPTTLTSRHFIHSRQSGGLWAYIRDLSRRERLANENAGKETAVQIVIGYNPAFLRHWEELRLIDQRGTTYCLREKPDEYTYDKGDITLTAYAQVSEEAFDGEDIYDE